MIKHSKFEVTQLGSVEMKHCRLLRRQNYKIIKLLVMTKLGLKQVISG